MFSVVPAKVASDRTRSGLPDLVMREVAEVG
jgi:hypothetical protein